MHHIPQPTNHHKFKVESWELKDERLGLKDESLEFKDDGLKNKDSWEFKVERAKCQQPKAYSQSPTYREAVA